MMLKSEELINKVKSYNKFLNPETLTKAYDFALKAHKTQKRDEGVPYINHPIAVADILSDLKLDSATIATGLLHDTIEDTHATYTNIKDEFGKEVADLVDGVTKISEFENKAVENSKAENFRKLILATSKDIRVLLVKIADRLHNMRTIKFVKDTDKQIRKAKETMEIYAPLADRMGMNRIRDELEDLSFQVLNNDARNLIKKRLDEIKEDKNTSFKNISFEFSDLLNQNNINCQIIGREKTPFSGFFRLIEKMRDFLFRCGTMNVQAGESGADYIRKYCLLFFDLTIILAAASEIEFAKELYRILRSKGKNVMYLTRFYMQRDFICLENCAHQVGHRRRASATKRSTSKTTRNEERYFFKRF